MANPDNSQVLIIFFIFIISTRNLAKTGTGQEEQVIRSCKHFTEKEGNKQPTVCGLNFLVQNAVHNNS